ncbi:hypothetical protein Y032_0022g608 [Ancylostoma ceylanicum]|uniref:G-protein coupled receptors family 1 profile domain-containing protein n=1 Tax=Ancylostoma ceylanicum TaxID=53326 RepID=A0A016V025_9BILA|nr:hypothetical protein Y032_0022g608 [Ancylostoma ceylanicum]
MDSGIGYPIDYSKLGEAGRKNWSANLVSPSFAFMNPSPASPERVQEWEKSAKLILSCKIPIGHIAVYTLAICSFHFLCWTPYWVSMMYTLYVEISTPSAMMETPSFKFIYFMYGVHALPYINSASNFVLYGLLNRQLHQSSHGKHPVNSEKHAHALLTKCSETMNHRVEEDM